MHTSLRAATVAVAVPLLLVGLSSPASAAELAPVAAAVDHLVAATADQLALSGTLASLGL
ncbi:hypothetical protein ACOQFV_03310 [Nocardiopsis changdeensis]|uniref:Uncharacterized protein n=1 Tax=Nocardiopsis changdeensis TaxID=2831969 RepID=A0ABX8BLN2_9ACTN|nr:MULTISPECIES: hypothetical protein [Nocardiopsis]QUX22645.1 hypothetical protein KGD84_30880 [Nocardiopsis changdeensis]QYX38588.1 hypothetical protein K1J57_08260 [Nocardiopsis sp. MT53]